MGPVGSAGTCSSGPGRLLALCHDALPAGPRLLSPFPARPCGSEMVWMGWVQPQCPVTAVSVPRKGSRAAAGGFSFRATSGTLFGTDFSGYFGELFLPDPGLHKSEVPKGPGLALQEQ